MTHTHMHTLTQTQDVTYMRHKKVKHKRHRVKQCLAEDEGGGE